MKNKLSRRDFVKQTSAIALATTFSAKSYARILGANEKVEFAIIGLHGRGNGLLSSLAECNNVSVKHICDVDSNELNKFSAKVEKTFNVKPAIYTDFRKMLEVKEIDVICIATPDHWHAPMSIMGLQAGKHIYVEKPCSHNPHEGELLIAAQKKYGKLVQMGNQQRSSPYTIDIIKKIHGGLIGECYMGKAWYSNTRKSIGVGKPASIPDYLNWDLWQGPAPRVEYKDNIHPYNWHWFWNWGTGETLNNGTHEVDLCRWALGVDYPNHVSTAGGRYHYQDDWEFYDTVLTNFEYGHKMISWEGKSCQGMKYFNRGRGATIHGTEGTVLIDRSGYEVYNRENKIVSQYKNDGKDVSMGIIGSGSMTTSHFNNFIGALKEGKTLNAPIADGNISCTMLHLSNIAWKMGDRLSINTKNGHILNNKKAKKMWSREYEKGWEPKI